MSFMTKDMWNGIDLDELDAKAFLASIPEDGVLETKYFIRTSKHSLGSNYNIYLDFPRLMDHTKVGRYRKQVNEDGIPAIYIYLETMQDLEILYRLVDSKPLEVDFYDHIITIKDN